MHRPRLIAQKAFHRIAIPVQCLEVLEDLDDTAPTDAMFVLTDIDAHYNLLERQRSGEQVLAAVVAASGRPGSLRPCAGENRFTER